jgi:HD-GYP domain-containing protein (c-di-GMP phosphodiesterase class II)
MYSNVAYSKKLKSYIDIFEQVRAYTEETYVHCMRVANLFSESIKHFNLFSELDLNELVLGALLHDVGKIAIPKRILDKKEKLNGEEWELLKLHPIIGGKFTDFMDKHVSKQIIVCHHEQWDGNGYPYGLKGNEIPDYIQFFSIIDAFDAMTYERSYRDHVMTMEEATAEIVRNSGKQFSPPFVDLFLRLPETLLTRNNQPFVDGNSIYQWMIQHQKSL